MDNELLRSFLKDCTMDELDAAVNLLQMKKDDKRREQEGRNYLITTRRQAKGRSQ